MRVLTPEEQQLLLDSTLKLALDHNIQDITLEMLTAACGLRAFDIVRTYQSKENILKAVLERELEKMAAAAYDPELRMPGETLRDELLTLGRIILEEHRRRVPFLSKILAEAATNKEVGALFYRTFTRQGRILFTQFLERRRELGELRSGIDLEAAAAMYLAALTGILLMVEVFHGGEVEPLDDDRVITSLTDVFLEGVLRK